MAFSHLASSLVLLTLTSSSLFFLQPHPTNADSHITCNFDKIYNFGDSLSDTGNLIREKPIGPTTAYARLPYGETFFKRATGRCSNGRLMIDFIAQAAGLPFLNPYLEKDADFKHGVNFAVAGAAALTTEDLAKMNVIDTLTNSSLAVQLDWMSKRCVIERGFDGETTQKACCGIGGDYNFTVTNMCSSEVPVCPDPNRFISWDGIHLTEASYKRMAEWLIKDVVPKLQCCN
ncbi:hypothetical protein RHMOL_Rhmol07G0246600 [Rhododendron molle]|uniref:Uncharacterized protein n=1 Tax=Rhododendron molle TaxID=49168 RepID=A0ACC0N5F8_RHOML|nr:hypothetical protein RHMOL_Rhmol07G0246600 [Rhododendron molle]